MSNEFTGAVKAVPEKVKLAIENYTIALEKAKAVVADLIIRAKTDTFKKKGWFWLTYNQTIEKWIKEDIHNRDYWFLSYEDLLRSYYPNELSQDSVSLINNQRTSSAVAVSRMFKHNPDEMYLNPKQAKWVSVWSDIDD